MVGHRRPATKGALQMTFRPIGLVLADVIGRLEMATDTGAATNAPRSVAPGEPGTEFVATGHERERTQPVAFAQDGGGTAAQTELGKKAGSRKAPRQLGGQEEHTQTRASRDWQAVSASLYEMYRCMGRDARARAPRATRPIHLCIDNRGHDTAPKALRAFRTSKAAATSAIPAMKP